MSEAATTDGSPRGRRRYRSPLREQRAAETRAAVLDAARRLFTTQGWASTGMREVAVEAGVATETLYSHFSSKRGLLRAVMDVGVVGDDQPVSLADRPEFAAIGRGERADRTRAAAQMLRNIQLRTAGLLRTLEEAAASDGEMADVLVEMRDRQRHNVAGAIELILDRPPTADERDGVWAIVSPEVYLLLTGSGWSLDRYEDWIADTVDRVLPHA